MSEPSNSITHNYAIDVANDSYNWYRRRAILTRRAHRASEVIFLVVSTSIPVSAVLTPSNAVMPAILGAVVVVLAGLRPIFHWHENYLRFTHSREAVEAERRLYRTNTAPYDDQATKDQVLVSAVSGIEQNEMDGWIKIAAVQQRRQ